MPEVLQIQDQTQIPTLARIIANGASQLVPAYFAAVMATGIVSVACHYQSWNWIAVALTWLNCLIFIVLVCMNLLRLLRFPCQMWNDLIDHNRGVGFFTLVAAVCVLGTQFLVVSEIRIAAIGLWWLGVGLWFVMTYIIFTSFAVKEEKPSLPDGIHGGWLVSVVAAQAVAVLGGLLATDSSFYKEPSLFFCLVMWLGGGMLYVWIISLIFYRYSFFKMSAADLAPAYWINMGAMAISTLAGTTLISVASDSTLLSQLIPFLKGGTLMFWATATWWIPMLVILGAWRHGIKRFGFQYEPQYWGLVFPLGMYSVCTYRLSVVLEFAEQLNSLRSDHDDLGTELHRLRELTNGFKVPTDACAKYREMLTGLIALERDMLQHVHLENNILLPRSHAILAQRKKK